LGPRDCGTKPLVADSKGEWRRNFEHARLRIWLAELGVGEKIIAHRANGDTALNFEVAEQQPGCHAHGRRYINQWTSLQGLQTYVRLRWMWLLGFTLMLSPGTRTHNSRLQPRPTGLPQQLMAP
jgi:hypothetical protein